MNFSKSVTRQLIAEAVCRGVVEQVPVSFELAGEDMPGHVRKAMSAALRDCRDIRARIEKRNNIRTQDGTLLIPEDKLVAFHARHLAVRTIFTESAQEEMPASQGITSAMAVAAAMTDQSPDRERKMDWNSLENNLTDIYKFYDPELSDTEAMQNGVADCEALMRITA